jgi:membrane protein
VKRYAALFRQTWVEFSSDKAPRLGAALAYYTVFSIAPLLLIAVAVAGMVFGREAAQGRITHELSGVLGSATAKAVDAMILAAAKPKSGAIATAFGVITLFLGAAGVFGQLKEALNTIWNVEPPRKRGLVALVRDRFLSLAMVLGVGFLLLVSLIFDTALSALGERLFPAAGPVLQAVQMVVSFGLITVLFAMIFRFLPDLTPRPEWRDVWFGAAFTSFLFVIGKFALGFYLGRSAFSSSYGAAGSLVVLLVWVYWSAQILFFGAEFTQVYARTHGSRIGTEKQPERSPAPPRSLPAPPPAFLPAVSPLRAQSPRRGGGGAIRLLAGGVGGLFVGFVAGAVAALVLTVKSARKLIAFR